MVIVCYLNLRYLRAGASSLPGSLHVFNQAEIDGRVAVCSKQGQSHVIISGWPFVFFVQQTEWYNLP